MRAADEAGEPVLVLGGGSNLVVADEGFAGHGRAGRHPRHQPRRRGRRRALRRRAGHRRGRRGLGRPGRPRRRRAAGSASRRCPASPARSAPPRSRTSARTARRSPRRSPRCGSRTGCCAASARSPNADCGFGYRHSRFKADPRRHVVLVGDLPVPPGRASARRSRTPSWPARSASSSAQRAPLRDVREAVLALRARQGHGARRRPTTTRGAPGRSSPTRSSTGRRRCPDGAPAWPQPDGTVKTSAAWLIEHAGFAKGYGDAARSASRPSTPSR